MLKRYLFGLAVLVLALSCAANAATIIGTSSIRAPAVILENNTGSLTNISLVITSGVGAVNITGPTVVGASTTQSAITAAMYAANYTHNVFGNYNYTYTIQDAGNNVSGPSAGAAMTMLAISAFTNRKLRTDFTMTGTISSNGSIGEIGGVYDKVQAAKNSGMRIVLVPKVASSDPEDELYLLVQTNFGIPLVQVANISQASYFAFNSNITGIANETNYTFYNKYNISAIPSPNVNCTGPCNTTLFKELLNATFNLTGSAMANLSANPKFANITSQFSNQLNQSVAIANKGYIYTAADLAFLNYVNVFYFNGYSTNRESALLLLQRVQNFCDSLNAPQLTTSNYDYVINAELRQAWGTYTINQTVSSYNISQIDSDQILDELYTGAQSNGWCTAANLVYQNAGTSGGSAVIPSSALKSIAFERLSAAAIYGSNLYYNTAKQAYNSQNYPVAILDADYAYVLSSTALNASMSEQQLVNATIRLTKNQSFGVWASEFNKEALFYLSQAESTGNSTLARTYAFQAYSSAMLASKLGTDTMIISQNLVPGVQQQQQSQAVSATTQVYNQLIILALIAIIIILLIINIILVSMLSRRNRNVRRKRNRK